MQDNIFIHTLFTVSETNLEDGIAIIIKRKIHLSQRKDGAAQTHWYKNKNLKQKNDRYIQVKSTANGQHVATTQHDTWPFLQHKTHNHRHSDTHEPFSLNNHTFLLFSSVLNLPNRKSRQGHFSLVLAFIVGENFRSLQLQAAAHHASFQLQMANRKINFHFFEDSRKNSCECSHISNRLNRISGLQTAHFPSQGWETHCTNCNTMLFGTVIASVRALLLKWKH